MTFITILLQKVVCGQCFVCKREPDFSLFGVLLFTIYFCSVDVSSQNHHLKASPFIAQRVEKMKH